jgi:hypothetical protein
MLKSVLQEQFFRVLGSDFRVLKSDLRVSEKQ